MDPIGVRAGSYSCDCCWVSAVAFRYTVLEAAALLIHRHPEEVEEHQGVGQEAPPKLGFRPRDLDPFRLKYRPFSRRVIISQQTSHLHPFGVAFFLSSTFFLLFVEEEHISPCQKISAE